MNKGIFIIVFLTFLIPKTVPGQSVKLFDTDNDISSSLINQVYADSENVIWIATEDGLNRYDGSKFTVFKHKETDSASIPNDYVKTIFESKDKRLLFGFFNGLRSYDRATQNFNRIPLLSENNSPFSSLVLSICQLKNGTILIGTAGQGIFELESEKNSAHYSKLNSQIRGQIINQIYQDSADHLWIATEQEGLYMIEESKKKAEKIHNFDINASDLIETESNEMYAGTLNQGFYHFDENQTEFNRIVSDEKNSFNLIKELFPWGKNQILIGTDGKGMHLYNTKTKKLSHDIFSVSSFELSRSKIHSITKDKSGNIWLAIFQKGLLFIPAKSNRFNYIGYKSINKNSIGSNAVTAILKLKNGHLLVGTDSDGLYELDSSGQRLRHLDKKDGYPLTVMSLFQDSNGELWLGSYLNGLAKISPDEAKINYFPFYDKNGEKAQHIYSITEENKQNLWVGTMGSGLFSINLETKKIKRFNGKRNADYSKGVDFLHNEWINTILYGSDNKIYLGTYDGLGRLDLSTESFLFDFGGNRILPGTIIYSIFEDDSKNLWLGTNEGLIKHPENSDIFQKFEVSDGLPNNVISAITEDEENNLWISTNHGISKFDPKTNNFINYFFNDGLQGNEFNKNALYKSQNGTLYFGGIHGVTYFKPEEILDKSPAPKLRITGFYIQNKKVKKGTVSGNYQIIDKPLFDAKEFNLSHNDNSFSIEFSTVDFDNPNHITYAYSMQNDGWISLTQGVNTVTFNNLEPGSYTFKVRAKDYNSFSDPEEIHIIIHPAWYFSTPAIIGYIMILIIIMGVIFFFIKQRIKIKRRLNEHIRIEQINDTKLQLYSNISHEIRTPITLILNPIKRLLENDTDEDRKKLYQLMKRNSERILNLVNQLMDVAKISKGEVTLKFRETEINSYIEETCLIFEDQLQRKTLTFQIHSERKPFYIAIDQQFFDKIIQNIVSNAIKFTPEGGAIELHINSLTLNGKEYCEVLVRDTGIGIEEEHLEKIFDRFHQVPDDRNVTGTGIGLHLSKSIVELHKGKIWAENNEGIPGSRFVIRIPVHQPNTIQEPAKVNEPEIKNPSNATNTDLSSSPANTEREPALNTKKSYKLLVVDDDDEMRNYLKAELSENFEMIACNNAKKAIPIVIKEKPDLIISDVVMPEMNGFAFSKKIKQNLNTNHIPVILLTARSGEKSNIEGLQSGADVYLNKPFNIQILKKAIINLIKNRELLKTNYSGQQKQADKVKPVKLKSSDERLLERIVNVVNVNISNPKLNVEMIAGEIGISRVHLYRKLKKLTNQSARDFIKNVRLKQAGILLAKKDYQISEVAYATGFSSINVFSKNFKEFYGMAPKEFMNSEKEKQNELLGED